MPETVNAYQLNFNKMILNCVIDEFSRTFLDMAYFSWFSGISRAFTDYLLQQNREKWVIQTMLSPNKWKAWEESTCLRVDFFLPFLELIDISEAYTENQQDLKRIFTVLSRGNNWQAVIALAKSKTAVAKRGRKVCAYKAPQLIEPPLLPPTIETHTIKGTIDIQALSTMVSAMVDLKLDERLRATSEKQTDGVEWEDYMSSIGLKN